jgi:peptidoglycan/xylan/chitin deacetylase (PgdA/CDA1 family)
MQKRIKMVITNKRWLSKAKAIIFLLIGACLFFQVSCVTPGLPPATSKEEIIPEKPLAPVMFQSDDYIVYILQGGETYASLAERFLGDAKKSWIIEDANEGVPFDKDETIVIPLEEENKGGLEPEGYQVVPILCYHRFAEDCKSNTCIPVHIFDQQMKYLKDNGFRVIGLGELLGFLEYRNTIPKKSVAITIDDGYSSGYEIAYPILKKYGFTATFFVYTDFINTSKNSITWDQLKELKKDGFEIGSHTLSHCDLTKEKEQEKDQEYLTRITKEIKNSKRIIDRELGQDTIHFSFPYGMYNQRILRICEQEGYKIAVSVERGGNPFFADPLFLNRDQILKEDQDSFISVLETFNRLSLR